MRVTFSLAQSGNSITGTYATESYSGTLTGTSAGNNVSLTLTSSTPGKCGSAFTGTVTGGTRMTGLLVARNCTVQGSDALSFVKQ